MGRREVKMELDKALDRLRAEAAKRFVLGRNSDHGPAHWDAVERNVLCLTLCSDLASDDIAICRLFAIFHDCERANEGYDPEHGHRAAEYIAEYHTVAIRRWIDAERFERLLDAYRFHNDGRTSDDAIIGICWDADRLELPRVGIIPEVRYFSTEQGRRAALRIIESIDEDFDPARPTI